MGYPHTQSTQITIPISLVTSTSFAIDGFNGGSFQLPSAMTATNVVRLETSNDNTNFKPLSDGSGAAAYAPALTVLTAYAFPAVFFNFQYGRIVFDGAGEAAERSLELFLRSA